MENKKTGKKNSKKIAIIVIIALLAAAVILCVLLPKTSAEPADSPAHTESAEPANPDSSNSDTSKPDSGNPAASTKPEASTAPTESAAPVQPGNTGGINVDNSSSNNQNAVTQTGGHHTDDHDGNGSYGSIPVETGNTIHHDEVSERQWIIDTPAYDEQVIVGYRCSCGQEKIA